VISAQTAFRAAIIVPSLRVNGETQSAATNQAVVPRKMLVAEKLRARCPFAADGDGPSVD
jgi:hypothetical protein